MSATRAGEPSTRCPRGGRVIPDLPACTGARLAGAGGAHVGHRARPGALPVPHSRCMHPRAGGCIRPGPQVRPPAPVPVRRHARSGRSGKPGPAHLAMRQHARPALARTPDTHAGPEHARRSRSLTRTRDPRPAPGDRSRACAPGLRLGPTPAGQHAGTPVHQCTETHLAAFPPRVRTPCASACLHTRTRMPAPADAHHTEEACGPPSGAGRTG